MHLRRLERKDAPLMLEWMHDRDVIKDLNTDFASKTIDDCIAFIESSINDKENLHLSITDEADEYMGTVSLKHIEDQSAEFGIAIRTMAMGKGYSKKAMEEILNRGFGELGLKSVYWCVSPINQRAVRFYEKSGYQRVTPKVLKLSRGGTAKHRFGATIGIWLQAKKGGTASKRRCPCTIEWNVSSLLREV